MDTDEDRLKQALRAYATRFPDLLKAHDIRKDLRGIAGERHYHQASLFEKDQCFLCLLDFRNEVHLRDGETR